MSSPSDVQSAITDEFTSEAPIALAVVVAGAGLAFGIKALWVAWRAGSKAMSKSGS